MWPQNNHCISLRRFLNKGSLFTEISKLNKLPFLSSADEITVMDRQFLIYYGDRNMFKCFIDYDLEEVAKIISPLLVKKWELLISADSSFENLATDYVRIRTVGENEDVSQKGEQTSKVSAYNSDELLTDSGVSSTGDANKNRSVDEKETYLSYKSLFDNLPQITKSNIISTALNDVANAITLTVY